MWEILDIDASETDSHIPAWNQLVTATCLLPRDGLRRYPPGGTFCGLSVLGVLKVMAT